MNTIREIQNLNKRELENGVSPEASWHADYRDTAYIYVGGLSFDLTEGDVITIFSQFGEPTYVNLVRDKETGRSKGFAFLKYEDQRSTDLAVDNLGGTTVLGRVLKVDHTRYKQKDDEAGKGNSEDLSGAKEDINNTSIDADSMRQRRGKDDSDEEDTRPLLKEERELQALIKDHDEDDPMKGYLVQEKKEEVAEALARLKDKSRKGLSSRKSHRYHHHLQKDDDNRKERYKRSRHQKDR